MTFDWWTLALQAINFLILVWILHRFLYKPVTNVIERRRQEIEAAQTEADKCRLAAEEVAVQCQARLDEVDEERRATLRDTRARIEDERRRVLVEARREADDLVAEARKQIAAERADALAALRDNAASLAVTLSESLLARTSHLAVTEAALERLDGHLAAMTAEEVRRLVGAPAKAAVTVTTAPALSPDGEREWRQRLARRLGGEVTIAFAADEDLIAGARIGFPFATLDFSWQGALAATKDVLVEHEPAA